MAKREFRNEFGDKNKVRVKVDGKELNRQFRHRGEAIDYLKDNFGFTKDEINRRVRFIGG
jgi:hypothetical protein